MSNTHSDSGNALKKYWFPLKSSSIDEIFDIHRNHFPKLVDDKSYSSEFNTLMLKKFRILQWEIQTRDFMAEARRAYRFSYNFANEAFTNHHSQDVIDMLNISQNYWLRENSIKDKRGELSRNGKVDTQKIKDNFDRFRLLFEKAHHFNLWGFEDLLESFNSTIRKLLYSKDKMVVFFGMTIPDGELTFFSLLWLLRRMRRCPGDGEYSNVPDKWTTEQEKWLKGNGTNNCSHREPSSEKGKACNCPHIRFEPCKEKEKTSWWKAITLPEFALLNGLLMCVDEGEEDESKRKYVLTERWFSMIGWLSMWHKHVSEPGSRLPLKKLKIRENNNVNHSYNIRIKDAVRKFLGSKALGEFLDKRNKSGDVKEIDLVTFGTEHFSEFVKCILPLLEKDVNSREEYIKDPDLKKTEIKQDEWPSKDYALFRLSRTQLLPAEFLLRSYQPFPLHLAMFALNLAERDPNNIQDLKKQSKQCSKKQSDVFLVPSSICFASIVGKIPEAIERSAFEKIEKIEEKDDAFKWLAFYHNLFLPMSVHYGYEKIRDDYLVIYEERKREIIKHGTKAAIASIMGRNMSHNIGSHVLSSIDFRTCNNSDQLTEFHSYLQKRMDLLARITGARPDWGEPMYFVGDLLKGFFNQTLLLNHIVHDQGGWEEDGIKFKVTLPCGSAIEFTWNGSDCSWTPNTTYKDFLVSIPDGNIGAQAFYIFMESMMRNSAKYGKKPEDGEPFTISIKAEEGIDMCYKLTIWDNLSACTDDLLIKIQSAIKERLVNESTGNLEASSLGIAEMREACSFLIYPYGKDCAAHEIDDTKLPLWAAIDGDKTDNDKKGNYLSYTFNITKPRMVAIVGKDDIDLLPDAGKNGIKLIKRDKLLTDKGAFQFVVIYVNNGETESVVAFIKENHRKLPQRLILAVDNDKCANNIVPARRAVVCKVTDLPMLSTTNISEQFILKVYETWITKRWHYNLDKKNIELTIAFERGEDAIWKRWRFIRESKVFKDKANLYVKQIFNDNGIKAQVAEILADGNGTQRLERKAATNPNGNESYTIYYDNHGVSSKGIGDFIHNVGSNKAGVDNKKIYETLSSPPQDGFGFDYFLLGLIEAGLTKVVVIDERVAEAAIDLNRNNTCRHLNELNKVLCYPLFAMRNGSACEATPLTQALICHYKERMDTKVLLDCADTFIIKSDKQGDATNVELDKPDIIVLHNGIVEKVFKETFGNDDDSTTVQEIKQLYTLIPSVVITSGRGKVMKDVVPADSPFIEFSTVRENTVQTISKYHLVRSLMSTKGVENE